MTNYSQKITAIENWFDTALNSLDSWGDYDQLQILICAHSIGSSHPSIQRKIEKLVDAPPLQSDDYVYEYLEQLIFIKYNVAQSKQRAFFNHWFEEGNYLHHSQITQAYQMGLVLVEENKLRSPETRQLAIDWLLEHPEIPSLSYFAWTIYYLAKNGHPNEAERRLKSILEERLDNGSWNNYPLQTVQVAYPIFLSGIAKPKEMERTVEFLLSQPWEGFTGEIQYETGFLKLLKIALTPSKIS